MTVRDLIALLSAEDPDRIVVMAKDAEGNGYSLVSGMWSGAYVAETAWHGEAMLETLTEDDIRNGFTEDDVAPPGAAPCVVIRPVH